MDTNTLRCIVNCNRILSQVIRVFSADEIPKRVTSFPIAWIINTDKKSDPGKHWVVFYISSNHEGEFFDNYGQKPSFYSDKFQTFFTANNLALLHNDKRLQSEESKTCGHYCIYFLVNRCRGFQMDDIIRTFSNNYNNNDLFVSDVIRSTFPHCTS